VSVSAEQGSDRRQTRTFPRRLGAAALIFALMAGALALVGAQTGVIDVGQHTSYRPWPVLPPRSASVDVGATTLPLARNSWKQWQPSDLETVNAFEHAIRKHASVVMWYADWANGEPSTEQLEAVAQRGSIPEITWEPWNSVPPRHIQPEYRLQNIIAGRFDSYIIGWAKTLMAYGKPVRLRFAQEMNGNWYPWSEQANGNRPHEFVRAWRHIHDLFRAVGATNVQWVWSPAAISIPAEQYPGDAYVSMVSLSVFNGGLQLRYSRWRSLTSLLERSIARLQKIAPDKPIELSEIGCAEQGGSKAAWIAGMFDTLHRYPAITSVIWYDLVKGSDWRIESSGDAAAAYAAGLTDQRYR
jgi:beta-mannanase